MSYLSLDYFWFLKLSSCFGFLRYRQWITLCKPRHFLTTTPWMSLIMIAPKGGKDGSNAHHIKPSQSKINFSQIHIFFCLHLSQSRFQLVTPTVPPYWNKCFVSPKNKNNQNIFIYNIHDLFSFWPSIATSALRRSDVGQECQMLNLHRRVNYKQRQLCL